MDSIEDSEVYYELGSSDSEWPDSEGESGEEEQSDEEQDVSEDISESEEESASSESSDEKSSEPPRKIFKTKSQPFQRLLREVSFTSLPQDKAKESRPTPVSSPRSESSQ